MLYPWLFKIVRHRQDLTRLARMVKNRMVAPAAGEKNLKANAISSHPMARIIQTSNPVPMAKETKKNRTFFILFLLLHLSPLTVSLNQALDGPQRLPQ